MIYIPAVFWLDCCFIICNAVVSLSVATETTKMIFSPYIKEYISMWEHFHHYNVEVTRWHQVSTIQWERWDIKSHSHPKDPPPKMRKNCQSTRVDLI